MFSKFSVKKPLTVLVGVVLVSGVFRVIGRLAEAVMDFRRW